MPLFLNIPNYELNKDNVSNFIFQNETIDFAYFNSPLNILFYNLFFSNFKLLKFFIYFCNEYLM